MLTVVGLAILRKKRGMTIIIGDAFNPMIKNWADLFLRFPRGFGSEDDEIRGGLLHRSCSLGC
jgi:hypothetical protein